MISPNKKVTSDDAEKSCLKNANGGHLRIGANLPSIFEQRRRQSSHANSPKNLKPFIVERCKSWRIFFLKIRVK